MERPLEVFIDNELNPDAVMTIEQLGSPVAVVSILSNSTLICGGLQIMPCDLSFETQNEYGNASTVQALILESDYKHIQISTLLSSNLICQVESLKDLAPFMETQMRIKKNEDDTSLFPAYLPALTIVGYDIEMAPQPNQELENDIRMWCQKHFKSIDVVDSIIDNNDVQNYVKEKGQAKQVAGKTLSGPMISSMLQELVYKIENEKVPTLLTSFERSVAMEARRKKEMLFDKYTSKIPQDVPVETDELSSAHLKQFKKALIAFDEAMAGVSLQVEVQDEKASLVDQIEAFYSEITDKNNTVSQDYCTKLFQDVFAALQNDQVIQKGEGSVSLNDFSEKYTNCKSTYVNSAKGPAKDLVFNESIDFIVPYLATKFSEYNDSVLAQQEELNQKIETLTMKKDEARQGEQKLRDLLDEQHKTHTAQMEEKETTFNDLEAALNTKLLTVETQFKEIDREYQDCKLELEEKQKEMDRLIETEKEILERRLNEAESKAKKLKSQNMSMEMSLEEAREANDKLIMDKNNAISEYQRKTRVLDEQMSMSSTSSNDAPLLSAVINYLEDISTNYSTESNTIQNNQKLMEEVAMLQRELNDVKRKEQEMRNSATSDMENRISKIQQDKESQEKQFSEMLKKQITEQKNLSQDIQMETEAKIKMIEDLRSNIRGLENEKTEILEQIKSRDSHVSIQEDIINKQKTEIENMQGMMEDVNLRLAREKTRLIEACDDNEILTNVLDKCLEIKVMRKNGVLDLRRVSNADNIRVIEGTCKKYSIKYIKT